MALRLQDHRKTFQPTASQSPPFVRRLCYCLLFSSLLLLFHARNLALRPLQPSTSPLSTLFSSTLPTAPTPTPVPTSDIAANSHAFSAAPVANTVPNVHPPDDLRPAPVDEAALPPPLTPLHFLSNDDHRLPALATQPFVAPRVLTSYIRPSLHRPNAYDLFLFTSSLFRRNLTVSHCVLANSQLISAASYIDDVTICILDELPSPGTPLSVALRMDKALRKTLAGPVSIAHGFDTRLKPGDLTRLPGGQFRVRSSVMFVPAHVDVVRPPETNATEIGPRYAMCLATMNRIGSHMMPDWVDHHRRLGIDHVFVFDNGATPPISTTPLGRRPDVEVLSWPWAKSQLLAFSFVLVSARVRCERLMLADVDEFLMLGLGTSGFSNGRRPLHALVQRVEEVEGHRNMLIHDVVMVNSGYTKRPTGHVAELYVHASTKPGHMYGKSICSMEEEWLAAMVHTCGWKSGRQHARLRVPTDEQVATVRNPQVETDTPVFVHFYWRSWEERVQKWRTGRGSFFNGVIAKRNAFKYRFDRPEAGYVRVDGRKDVARFTVFRDFWRRVRWEARERVRECVVATVRNGRRETRTVSVDVAVDE